MVCNFPDNAISMFIHSITSGWSSFGSTLKLYWGNLQNGEICRVVGSIRRRIQIWLVEHNFHWGMDRTMDIDRIFGSAQNELSWFGSVWTMEAQCSESISYESDCYKTHRIVPWGDSEGQHHQGVSNRSILTTYLALSVQKFHFYKGESWHSSPATPIERVYQSL